MVAKPDEIFDFIRALKFPYPIIVHCSGKCLVNQIITRFSSEGSLIINVPYEGIVSTVWGQKDRSNFLVYFSWNVKRDFTQIHLLLVLIFLIVRVDLACLGGLSHSF